MWRWQSNAMPSFLPPSLSRLVSLSAVPSWPIVQLVKMNDWTIRTFPPFLASKMLPSNTQSRFGQMFGKIYKKYFQIFLLGKKRLLFLHFNTGHDNFHLFLFDCCLLRSQHPLAYPTTLQGPLNGYTTPNGRPNHSCAVDTSELENLTKNILI